MNIDQTEIQLVGLILSDPEVLSDIQKITRYSNPFSDERLNIILKHSQSVFSSFGKIPHRELLKSIRDSENGFKLDFIADVKRHAGFKASVSEYQSLILERIVKRELAILGNKIINCHLDDVNDYNKYLSEVRDVIDRVESNAVIESDVTIPQAVKMTMEKCVRLTEGTANEYMPTGINAIDSVIVGLQKKTMCVVGARPSVGKSACALSMMSNMALMGKTCGFISVEMSVQQCVERIIQVRSGVSVHDFAMQRCSEADLAKFQQVAKDVRDSKNLIISRTTDRDISNIRSIARKMKAKNPKLDVIFIDYLQKITARGYDNKRLEVSHVSGILTDMSTDLDISVVALAQLNRDSDGGAPTMKHLKESSGIEEDAHLIALIHRDINERVQGSASQQAQLLIVKNRDGKTGIADVSFTPKTTKFGDVAFGDSYQEQGF